MTFLNAQKRLHFCLKISDSFATLFYGIALWIVLPTQKCFLGSFFSFNNFFTKLFHYQKPKIFWERFVSFLQKMKLSLNNVGILTVDDCWNGFRQLKRSQNILVCSYSAIIRRVRQPTGSINSAGRLNLTVRRKVTRMAMFLVASYAVCYTPYHFWQVFRLIGIPVSSPSVSGHRMLLKICRNHGVRFIVVENFPFFFYSEKSAKVVKMLSAYYLIVETYVFLIDRKQIERSSKT